jgi:hypothetical protein
MQAELEAQRVAGENEEVVGVLRERLRKRERETTEAKIAAEASLKAQQELENEVWRHQTLDTRH